MTCNENKEEEEVHCQIQVILQIKKNALKI